MRAMQLLEENGVLIASDIPVPEPDAQQILIRVKACGIGYTLTNLRAGLLGGSVDARSQLGSDGRGE